MTNYLKNWNDFLDKALNLLIEDPITSRVTLKYNNVKNTAIIKVTNDKKNEEDFPKIEHIINISARLYANIPEEFENNDAMEEEKEQEKIDPSKKKDKKKKNKKRT